LLSRPHNDKRYLNAVEMQWLGARILQQDVEIQELERSAVFDERAIRAHDYVDRVLGGNSPGLGKTE
jgi:hypothetical protein